MEILLTLALLVPQFSAIPHVIPNSLPVGGSTDGGDFKSDFSGGSPAEVHQETRSDPIDETNLPNWLYWEGVVGPLHWVVAPEFASMGLHLNGIPWAVPRLQRWTSRTSTSEGSLLEVQVVACDEYQHAWALDVHGRCFELEKAFEGVLACKRTDERAGQGPGEDALSGIPCLQPLGSRIAGTPAEVGSAGTQRQAGIGPLEFVQGADDEAVSLAFPLGSRGPRCGARVLELAIETDRQFASRFASVQEAGVYLTALAGMAQQAMASQLNWEVRFPYLGLNVNSDVWLAPDGAGTTVSMLAEFEGTWPLVAPMPTHGAHFISGVLSGPGMDSGSTVCEAGGTFAVHPHIQNPDGTPRLAGHALSLMHAIGHSAGAMHTSEFCPPLDLCNPMQLAGPCQSSRDCSSLGSVMSFCHLCPGGIDGVPLRFHPVNLNRMTSLIEPCLAANVAIELIAAEVRQPGEPWQVRVLPGVALAEPPELRVWGPHGAFDTHAMVMHASGGFYAEVEAASCGFDLEARVSLVTQACGSFVWPNPTTESPIRNRVRERELLFRDDCSVDRGWSSLPGSGSAGFWVRSVPVDDPVWPFDPASDAGGDGWCFLTGNYFGNSDVDGGTVELLSPGLFIEAWPVWIEFDSFFSLANENGNDRIVLEVSRSGLLGPWFPIWRSSNPHGWRRQEILPEAFRHLGWQAPLSLQFRFLVRDGLPPSAVEAGIDGVTVYTSSCPGD